MSQAPPPPPTPPPAPVPVRATVPTPAATPPLSSDMSEDQDDWGPLSGDDDHCHECGEPTEDLVGGLCKSCDQKRSEPAQKERLELDKDDELEAAVAESEASWSSEDAERSRRERREAASVLRPEQLLPAPSNLPRPGEEYIHECARCGYMQYFMPSERVPPTFGCENCQEKQYAGYKTRDQRKQLYCASSNCRKYLPRDEDAGADGKCDRCRGKHVDVEEELARLEAESDAEFEKRAMSLTARTTEDDAKAQDVTMSLDDMVQGRDSEEDAEMHSDYSNEVNGRTVHPFVDSEAIEAEHDEQDK